ncbi:MAG TPA: hypothetical protein VMW63_03605 [Methanoregulaceae archaeon]|nr:hypothetical protein [Methanoregulaceae archaeon]
MSNNLIKVISIGFFVAMLLVSIPCVALDNSLINRYITTSTSVSGQAVVNETTTIRWSTVSEGIPDKMEWSSISVRQGPVSESWTSSLAVGSGEERLSWFFQRTGSLGTVSLRQLLDQYH